MTTKELIDLQATLINVAQLLDGWHCDTAWTEYDTKVRQQVTEALKVVEMDLIDDGIVRTLAS